MVFEDFSSLPFAGPSSGDVPFKKISTKLISSFHKITLFVGFWLTLGSVRREKGKGGNTMHVSQTTNDIRINKNETEMSKATTHHHCPNKE